MHEVFRVLDAGIERFRPQPVLRLAGALELDRHQFLAAHPALDQPPHARLAPGIEVADRIQAHDALRAQRTVEQMVEDLAFRRGLRQPLPAEMPGHQLVGLEHPAALADGEEAAVERQLQRALRRLAARPGVVLVHQHVVVDVPDRQRALGPDAAEHLAQIRRRHRREPDAAALPVPLHGADVEPHVGGWNVRQRMRPVLEHGFVDGLRLVEVLAPVSRNARIEDVVMAALDHVDGVDLHVAQMRHRRGRRLRPLAERRGAVEPLGAQPDASGVGFGEREGGLGRAGHGRRECTTARFGFVGSETAPIPCVNGSSPTNRFPAAVG